MRGIWLVLSKRFAFFPTATNVHERVVEEIDEEKNEDDLQEPDAQSRGYIEFAESGCHLAESECLWRPLGDTGEQTDNRGGKNADQHSRAHTPGDQRPPSESS